MARGTEMHDRRCVVVDEDGRTLVLRADPDGEPMPFYGADVGALGPCFEREGEEPTFGHVIGAGPTFFSKAEAEMMIAFLHKGCLVEKTVAELEAKKSAPPSLAGQVDDLLERTIDRLKRPTSNVVSLADRKVANTVQGVSMSAGASLTLSLVSKKTRTVARVEIDGPATLKQVHLGRRFWMTGQGLTDDGELEDVPGSPDAKTVDEHTRIQVVVETTGAGMISARLVDR